jgi:hypothetical protein
MTPARTHDLKTGRCSRCNTEAPYHKTTCIHHDYAMAHPDIEPDVPVKIMEMLCGNGWHAFESLKATCQCGVETRQLAALCDEAEGK